MINNKPKKFRSIITKIISQINTIVSEINTQIKKHQTLFVHTIAIKLNSEKKALSFYLNSDLIPSWEIKIDPIYLQDTLKQLNEILNKVHFFNYHIRIIICEEKTSLIYLELQSKNLTIPNFSEVINNFSNFYEKKLDKENFIIKYFGTKNEKYEIKFDLCCIFHNMAKFGTFDLVLFNDRLYDFNLSKDDNILNSLKTKMDFNLSEDNTYIYFNKLKENSISLFIFGNYQYTKIDNDDNDDAENKIIYEFIVNNINSVIEEFYEKIKLFSENKQMVFYFNIITGCLKDIYTTTNDQEVFDTFNKLFEPMNKDPKYIQKKLAKNFMLCSSSNK